MAKTSVPKHKDASYGLIIAFILAAAFSLRIWGIRLGLPELYHADEPIVVNHALAYGASDLNPYFFKIPPLISYLLSTAYGFYFILGHIMGQFSGVDNFARLFLTDPSSFYFL